MQRAPNLSLVVLMNENHTPPDVIVPAKKALGTSRIWDCHSQNRISSDTRIRSAVLLMTRSLHYL